MLFDWLVTGHVLEVNPAHAVRGPKYVVRKGKTPVLTAEEARELPWSAASFSASRAMFSRASEITLKSVCSRKLAQAEADPCLSSWALPSASKLLGCISSSCFSTTLRTIPRGGGTKRSETC